MHIHKESDTLRSQFKSEIIPFFRLQFVAEHRRKERGFARPAQAVSFSGLLSLLEQNTLLIWWPCPQVLEHLLHELTFNGEMLVESSFKMQRAGSIFPMEFRMTNDWIRIQNAISRSFDYKFNVATSQFCSWVKKWGETLHIYFLL